jgi:hypothetical protein
MSIVHIRPYPREILRLCNTGLMWNTLFYRGLSGKSYLNLTSFSSTGGQVSPAHGQTNIRMRKNLWIADWQRFLGRLSNFAYNRFSRLNPGGNILKASIRLKSKIWPENYLLGFFVNFCRFSEETQVINDHFYP